MESLSQLKHKIETTINTVKVLSFDGADLVTNKGTFTMAHGQFFKNDKPFNEDAMKKFTGKFKYPPAKVHKAPEHSPGKVNPPFVYSEEFKMMWLAALQGKSLKSFETDEDEVKPAKKGTKAVAKTATKKPKQKRVMSPEAKAKLLAQLAKARQKLAKKK